MMQFADIFADFQIVVTLSRQLSWSHFINLIPIKNEAARAYYAQQIAQEGWSVRETRKQIERKAFERREIANLQITKEQSTLHNSFKDPYFLDFLGLILCAEKSHEQIELLEMGKDGILVAEYWTKLPPKNELEAKLHSALMEARENINRRKSLDL